MCLAGILKPGSGSIPWLEKDKADYLEKQQEQKDLRERLEQLKSQNVAAWEEERASIVELCKRREKVWNR